MSLLQRITRAFVGDPGEPAMLDHVPVTGCEDWRARKLDEARRKLGKPFAHEVKVARLSEPSHTLAHIQSRSEQARKVTNIDSRRKVKP